MKYKEYGRANLFLLILSCTRVTFRGRMGTDSAAVTLQSSFSTPFSTPEVYCSTMMMLVHLGAIRHY